MSDTANIDALVKRRNGQRNWLEENHPEVFNEQKHVQKGTIERAYWHYGYMVALGDVLHFLGVEKWEDEKPSSSSIR